MGIQGLGGVGKSAIAAYLYHSVDLQFEHKFWADVSLKPDFTVFAEKIITDLKGKKADSPIDISELINNLLGLLSQRRCLLVVDNLETLLDEERNWQDEYYQAFFTRWKQQGTNSTLLITTQDKPQLFQGLSQWYALGGMKLFEGVELFKKFGIVGTDEELKAIVEYLNGHPLTIKLVAGFLGEYCNSQLDRVAALELAQFDLAYEEATGDHRHKQDARLSWIIQQHLARLNSKQKQLLTNLSVYRLPFSLEAARYMLVDREVKPFVVQKKLQEFGNRSLLIKTEDNKFQFESLVQKFILQQATELTNAHQQAIKYYRNNLKDRESWQVLADVSEYLEIIDHYCELQLHNLANNALDICLDFLNLRGYYAVLVEIYEKLIRGWQLNLQQKDRFDYASANNKLANTLFYIGEYKTAINYYEQCLEIAQEISITSLLAHALNNLGNIYNHLGKNQTAIVYLKKSLDITQNINDISTDEIQEYKYIEANSLNNLGNIYNHLKQYQTAISYIKNFIKITKNTEDIKTKVHSLNNLGNAYKGLRKYKTAIKYYKNHWQITQQTGDLNEEARCLNNLGDTYASLKDYSQAIDYFQQSLEIKQQIGDRNGEAITWFNLGITYNNLQQQTEAKAAYKKAKILFQAMGLAHYVEKCDEAIKNLD